MCRALANNLIIRAMHVLACQKVVGHFRDFGQSFHNCIKILYFLVTRMSEVLGYNVRAFSEFYTLTAKMPG